MGGIGGPGGDAGDAFGGFTNASYGGSNQGNFGGGGAAMGPGYETIAPPPVSALIGTPIGQTMMSGEELHAYNEQMAQQSLPTETEAQQMVDDAMFGTNNAQNMSFGYGNSMPFPEAGLPQGGGNFLTNYLLPALNMATNIAIPMGIPAKAGIAGLFGLAQALLSGKDIGQALGQGFKGAATSAMPLPVGLMLGQLPDQGTGNVANIGTGIPGETGGYTDVAQATPAVAPPVAGPSPVAQAVAPSPMLSAQPFGWYSQGMKRVNMPWVSQPGSQQLRGNPSGNYGGMKRVG